MKKFLYILIPLIAFLLFIPAISNAGQEKIDPYLQTMMNSSQPGEKLPVYIKFNNHLGLNDFADISYDTPKKERREIVINRLQNYANTYQNSVRTFLQTRSALQVQDIEILWIVNVIALKSDVNTINTLAVTFSEIQQICYDPQFPTELLLDYPFVPVPFFIPPPPEQGCLLMNADDCWALGNKGAGVVVGNADDGFHWRHPDMVNHIWQNLGEDANHNGYTIIIVSGTGSYFDPGDLNNVDDDGNGKVDDLIGWDFDINSYNITASSHGSATMGHVIGDGTGGTQTGVAPEAKGICLRNSGGGYTTQISAFQYGLLKGADVFTSSLSWKWWMNPKPDYSLMRTATDVSLAGGMIHSNSTSNDGNSNGVPLNISSAGCNPAPWRHPDQQKVGNLSGVIGVGNVGVTTDIIESSSPRGPTLWGNWSLWGPYTYTIDPNHRDYPYSYTLPLEKPDSMGLIKPDVSSPGQGSTSCSGSGTGYQSFGGTSSATPHTAGCLALMLSINPEMLPSDLDRVLELTAIEKGAPGKDTLYGAGRIDALLATTSPSPLMEGVNGGSEWVLGQTTPPNDTAHELVGLKIINTNSPWIGSLRKLVYNIQGTATTTDVEKFRLFWDVNMNKIVDAGDRLLKEAPFISTTDFAQVIFDTLKFKTRDTVRYILLTVKTKSTANSSHVIEVGMPNNTYVTCYYTVNAQPDNFPFGNVIVGITRNNENPLVFSLSQNYPNPFNPTTIINYTLQKKSFITVKVYDVIGRETAVLLNNTRDAGRYSIEFDANFYKNLSSGVYFYKLEASDPEAKMNVWFSDIKKMVLVK